jgi:hypothetical protein
VEGFHLIGADCVLPGFYCRWIHLHRHSRSLTRNASNWILCQDNISSVGCFRVWYGCCASDLLDRVAGFARQRMCTIALKIYPDLMYFGHISSTNIYAAKQQSEDEPFTLCL